MFSKEEIKRVVQESYRTLAQSSCCTSCGPSSVEGLKRIGYVEEELQTLPEEALRLGAGCGNPVALAELREGEVVLDLGSGGGIDALLAAKRVGPKGRVIGVDMTEEMNEKAWENAKKMGLENVEFKLAEIEDLPLDAGSVDVIISNCVINLSPDKDRVFKEAFRVLRSGGRMVISDIVSKGDLPEELKKDPEAWACCVAGAIDKEEYLQKIKDAGFKSIEVLGETPVSLSSYPFKLYSLKLKAFKP